MSDGATTCAPASACDKACLDQHGHGLVIDDIPVVIDETVLSVAGVGIQRDIGDDTQRRHCLPHCGNRPLNQTVRIERLFSDGGLLVIGNHRKQRNGGDTQRIQPTGPGNQAIDRQALYARHGRHGHALIVALHDEAGLYQVRRGEHIFPHHSPRELVATHASHTNSGESRNHLVIHRQMKNL